MGLSCEFASTGSILKKPSSSFRISLLFMKSCKSPMYLFNPTDVSQELDQELLKAAQNGTDDIVQVIKCEPSFGMHIDTCGY